MNWASSEIVTVLTFLLPGIVASAIFHSLTAHPKPNEFDRIVQALIFTTVVQAIVKGTPLVQSLIGTDPFWREDSEIAAAVLVAVIVALIAVYVSNHDTLHGFLRWIRMTKENSYPSEWYSTFTRNPDCYVVLHLKGERRLYGWPEEWPSRPDQGHFRIAEAEWLTEQESQPITGVSVILVPGVEVEMVEFLEMKSSELTEE
jgi:hypothetical protein